jgi:hypothetical protein
VIRPGDIVSIHVRPEGVHVFDADSGARLGGMSATLMR